MRTYLFLSFFILCFLIKNVRANTTYPDVNDLSFLKITQKNGLSHNNIECIFKDSEGYIWFGTRNGLCRFDGYEIRIYRAESSPGSLTGDRILSVIEDKKGFLWVGTYSSGLNRFDKKTERFTSYSNHESVNDRINRIKVLKDGSVWICSNKGLAEYLPQQDSFRLYLPNRNTSNSIIADYVHDIIETKSGEIYVASESNAIHFFDRKTGTFKQIEYKRAPGLASNYRKRIVEDNNGVLWIAANVHGLSSYNPATGESEIFLQGNGRLSTNILMGDMAISPEGDLWISTDGGGINILNPRTRVFSYLRKDEERKEGLSSDHVYTIYFDDLNIVWIGTFGEGVNYFDPARYKFKSWLYKPGDLSSFLQKSVLCLYQDRKDRLWIGTDGDGLYMFDEKGKLHEYYHEPGNPNSLSTDVITCINEDNDGNLLIGTYSGGLNIFNPEKSQFTQFRDLDPHPGNIGSDNVWRILNDSKGRIWLGLLGNAVDLFDPVKKSFTNYGPNSPRPDRINYQNVMDIMEDSDGDIWFATEGEGVYLLDEETDRVLRIYRDNENNVTTKGIVRCLYQDSWENIWIGTEGQGLFRYNKKNGKLDQYSTSEGLPNDMVQSIKEDSQGNLWLGTSGGMAVMNPKTVSFRVFIDEDGLSGNEFNQDALIHLKDGRLAAGTTNGVDIFRPEKIKLNQNLPRLMFTSFEVMNHKVHPGDEINNRVLLTNSINYTNEIILTHKEKIFSISFAALNYTLPEKCTYRFMLEGFDEEWNETSNDYRKANYSNLAPGIYTFRVKASNNDGKWGNNERLLKIRVLPPFYKTWWFKGLLIVFLVMLTYLIYRYRLSLHKQDFLQKQAEQDKKIIQLENEKLESELQKLTFHIINRNRLMVDQKNRLMGLSVQAKESVKAGLQDIITKIDEDLNEDKDWKFIEPQLDKVYNNFVTRLKEKHPDLTLSEIRIAAYIRMNLSTKEISEFMHKTSRAVENDRYRLRKKIGLDLNDSLQHYLINL